MRRKIQLKQPAPNAEPLFRSTQGGRFLRKVFERMFLVVGRVFTPEFVMRPEWFLKSSWTAEQENEFQEWMIREGMKTFRWRKRQARKEVGKFLLDYGWTAKTNESPKMPKKLTGGVQHMLDSSAKNLKRGKASLPINRVLSKRAKTVASSQSGRDTRADQPAHSRARDPRVEAAYARGRIVRKKMLAAEGGNISADEAAQRLGVTRATLLRRYRNGRVLGWKEPGEAAVHFPVWQFKGGELLPGLPEVLSALVNSCAELDDMGRIGFFLCQFGFLGPRRPLDLLRKGQIGDALLAAQAFTQP